VNGVTALSPNLQAVPASKLYWTTANASLANNYNSAAQINNAFIVSPSASVTINGSGSDINSSVATLNLGAGSTTTVQNQLGTGWIGVIGATTIGGAGVILRPDSAVMNLVGGVVDGGNGLTKTGNGTLILGPSAGTFTGNFTANAGFVQVTAPNSLTTGTTTITTNPIATFTRVGNTANDSQTLTLPAGTSASGFVVGAHITGTNIQSGTYVVAVQPAHHEQQREQLQHHLHCQSEYIRRARSQRRVQCGWKPRAQQLLAHFPQHRYPGDQWGCLHPDDV
jgi:autotransporter-associated beta strand protein